MEQEAKILCALYVVERDGKRIIYSSGGKDLADFLEIISQAYAAAENNDVLYQYMPAERGVL